MPTDSEKVLSERMAEADRLGQFHNVRWTDEVAALESTLASRTERVAALEARMGEYERALHPGDMPKAIRRAENGLWWADTIFEEGTPDMVVRLIWCYCANRYEQATHKKVDGEKA